jgi:hypothetical protein
MINRDGAVLAFKLLGLWLMATAVGIAAAVPAFWVDAALEPIRRTGALAGALPAVVGFGVGYAIWFAAEWLAGRIFEEGSAEERLRAEPSFAIALTIMGALFIAEAVPVLVHNLAIFHASRDGGFPGITDESQQFLWTAQVKANVAENLTRLVIGLLLLTGPARLGMAVARLRREFRSELEEPQKPTGL